MSLPLLRALPTVSKVPRQPGEVFCDMWEIPGFKYDPGANFEDDPDMRRAFGEGTYILRAQNPPPRLGDLVKFTDMGDSRNEGVAVWDGEKIIDLETEPDEYGVIPKMFRVLEPTYGKNGTVAIFPPVYWHDPYKTFRQGVPDRKAEFKKGVIQHNDNVWFNHTLVANDLLQNMRYDTALGNGKFTLYSIFNVNYPNGTVVYGIGMSHDIINDIERGSRPVRMPDSFSNTRPINTRKIDEQTLQLSQEYLNMVHTAFVKKIQSTELEAFSLSEYNDRFDPNDALIGKVLWWFYREDDEPEDD